MFKHILVPTDGSRLAAKGVRAGVKLAGALGAKVTGVYVIPPYPLPAVPEGARPHSFVSPAAYQAATEKEARRVLAEVEIEAQAAGVPCRTRFVTAERPWQGILDAAKKSRSDVIAIGSHGRSSLGGLLLGSETSRVLSHSKIPVLVLR